MSFLEQAVEAIRRARPRNVVFFTGAGVSAESGIPTFRGAGGLWRNFRAEDLATPEAFARDPELVLEWYEWRRGLIRAAEPNAAHLAIARMPDAPVVTQNVDGLHARAGSRNVIELHAAGLVSLCRGLSIEINPQASGVSSACTLAIPMTAANATPPIVDAILEER